MRTARRHFASDNYAGICPEAWQALENSNGGHAPSYGDDPWTAEAADLLRETFGMACEVFFVFNGTAANSLSLASLGQSFHSILCHETAHVESDECGAPEFFSNGMKVLTVPGANGKIDPAGIERMVKKRSDVHYPKPRAVSITQSTELGTVYSIAELKAIWAKTKQFGLSLHMDGARFANAVASLGCKPSEVTWEAGVDVLCFGGTKNGTAVGDAVVFFNRELAREFDYRCKQAGQLASKMRVLSAPWVGLLKGGAWLRHAAHANAMAALLHDELVRLPELRLMFPRQANAVFIEMPPWLIVALRAAGWKFYTFIGQGGCRLMCAWDTTEDDVRAFVADVKRLLVEAPKDIPVGAANHRKVRPGQPMSHRRPQTGGVKNILSVWSHGVEAVANFGQATLHRHRNGRYELHGGSASDHQAALEWASLFRHDAVFTPPPPNRTRSVLSAPAPRW